MGGMRLARFRVAHLLDIAVIGGDEQQPAGLPDRRLQPAEAGIDRLDRLDGGIDDARMADHVGVGVVDQDRSEEHTSELQSLMRISYAVFCLKKTNRRIYET